MALEEIDINSESLSATTISADTIHVGGNLISLASAILPSLSAVTFSANTYYSGSTPLDLVIYNIVTGNSTSTLVQPGLNTYTGGTPNKPTVNISAATLNYLSATTISGDTYYSGSTPLETIIASIAANNENTTYVQSGLNTYTGGTPSLPTINISAATLTYLSATTISGDTIYSGNTDISTLFGSASAVATLQAQIVTKANRSGDTFTGQINAPAFSATTISGGTYYSASTPLETIIYNIATLVGMSGTPGVSTYVQPGLNTYTGGTPSLPTVNISAATLSYLSATTISGGTIYSGSTSLETVIYNIASAGSSSGAAWDFQVISSGDTSRLTTTSTTFADIPGMSATTKNFGTSATTYQVMFTCDASNSINNAQIIVRLRKNGAELSGTTRNVTMAATNQRLSITTMGFATDVSSGDVFNAQWRVNTGTATMTGRTFSILGTKTNNVI